MTRYLLATTAPALLALAVATTTPARADWQTDLADEALIMEDCVVSFLTQVIEREIDGRAVVIAKVHCQDGRTFDASRPDALSAFDFAICQPPDEPAAC